MAVAMDILGELDKRGIVEAVEKVIGFSTFQSALQMHYVSKKWLDILSRYNVWRLILMREYMRNKGFRKMFDTMSWSKFLQKKCATTEDNQLKYLAFVTLYINEKQKLVMESQHWDESETPDQIYVDTEDVRHSLICGDWLLLARGPTIYARHLAGVATGRNELPPRPEKVFEIEAERRREGGRGTSVCQIATDADDKPWRRSPRLIVGVDEASTSTKLRCNMWDFETGALLLQIPLNNRLSVYEGSVTRALFVKDMFVIVWSHAAEIRFKGQTRGDFSQSYLIDLPLEEIIHVTEKDDALILVTHHKTLQNTHVLHCSRDPGKLTFNLCKREVIEKPLANFDEVAFYKHLCLDFDVTFRQHYTLRDLSKPSGDQIIWSSQDTKFTFKLIWSGCYLSSTGLTVNFYSGMEHHSDRSFVTLPLEELLNMEDFTVAIRKMISWYSLGQTAESSTGHRRSVSNIGAPSRGYFHGDNPAGSYLILGRVLTTWMGSSRGNDIQIINMRKVHSSLL